MARVDLVATWGTDMAGVLSAASSLGSSSMAAADGAAGQPRCPGLQVTALAQHVVPAAATGTQQDVPQVQLSTYDPRKPWYCSRAVALLLPKAWHRRLLAARRCGR